MVLLQTSRLSHSTLVAFRTWRNAVQRAVWQRVAGGTAAFASNIRQASRILRVWRSWVARDVMLQQWRVDAHTRRQLGMQITYMDAWKHFRHRRVHARSADSSMAQRSLTLRVHACVRHWLHRLLTERQCTYIRGKMLHRSQMFAWQCLRGYSTRAQHTRSVTMLATSTRIATAARKVMRMVCYPEQMFFAVVLSFIHACIVLSVVLTRNAMTSCMLFSHHFCFPRVHTRILCSSCSFDAYICMYAYTCCMDAFAWAHVQHTKD
jgi:hypothetical protein